MRRSVLFGVFLTVLVCETALPGPAEATFRRGFYRPVYRPAYPITPAHMPGWDWQRIYPYSPYNYGRNPYNPIVVNYPYYVNPYPYPGYYPPVYTPTQPEVQSTSFYRAAEEPSVSGPLSSPPPGTALIRVHAPDEWAKIQFDGVTTSRMGIDRTFVTPTLEAGKKYRYVMTVTWTQDGKPMSAERVIRIQAGQIQDVDLTQKAKPAETE
jgi:uncharacterized protein (TIGR03000 family)